MSTAPNVFEFNDRHELMIWGLAAFIVAAAHIGVIATHILLRDTYVRAASDVPVVIIELAPLPVAPSSDVDVAVGPQMQESPKAPEEDKTEKEELPPKTETPVVAMPEPPKAEQKEMKPPAPRTTAPQRNLASNAAVAAGPPPSWINSLFSHLLRYRQYPSSAVAHRQEGVVTLAFTMDRNGHVLSRHIAHSSGVSALDAEALAMIDRAQPLPAFPPQMTEATRSFTAPIRFSLK